MQSKPVRVFGLLFFLLASVAIGQEAKPLAADDKPKPHAELAVKLEDGVSVSYLKVTDESLPRQTVTIEIVGFSSNQGACAVMLASDKAKYSRIDPRKPRNEWIGAAATAADTTIVEQSSKFVIKDIPNGEYVVAAFHDENTNQLLDSNRLGIPKESYGFSNGVRWRLKIPRWNTAHIKVDEEHTTFTVRVQ